MENINSVLIIDDDDDDLLLIEDRLNEFVADECRFVTCSEKLTAIKLLTERTFDLCILDHRLAGYEGIEVLEAVADAELATPIIMLTGQDDDEVAKMAIRGGAQDFVMKSSIDDDIFEKSVRYAVSRKELEFARLLGRKSEAENVAKDKFIAHLSHELRTPLTSILGYTSLLLEKEDTLDYRKELSIISNNGKHLLSLLNDVLDLSKIAVNKFELKERPTDLQTLLIEVNSLLLVNALDKGLFLEFSANTALPQKVSMDGVRFKQIMLNLVGNAVKFTERGGITVSVGLNNGAEGAQLNIQISDTGIGMAEHQISDIFAPFKQLEDVTNRSAGGAGLGLSITAEIVKQMGGELTVKSTPQEGSLFTLQLPCKTTNPQLVQYDFNLSYAHSNLLKTPQFVGRVLVVDDVFEIRQLAGYFIKETGVVLEFASNGKQALEKVASCEDSGNPFDAIFMDLHMPVLTGKETVKKLREIGNTCSIIAMTAAVNKGLHQELLQIGFDQLIAKPIDKQELYAVLEKVLKALSPACEDTNNDTSTNVNNVQNIVHLVEDDMDSAQVMKMMLAHLGYQVVHSASAQQAIDTVKKENNFSHHLLDLGLPDLQGLAFIKLFFEQPVAGKVSILSGNQPDTDMLDRFPITDHLVKPITKEMLKECLQR